MTIAIAWVGKRSDGRKHLYIAHQKQIALQKDAKIRHSKPRQVHIDHYQDDVFIRGFQNSEFQGTGDEKVFKYRFVEIQDNNRYSSV